MRARLLGTWAICVLAAYGCGGGGSSTPPPSPDAHDAPRGDAAVDRGGDQRADTAVGDTNADRGDAVDTGASDAPRDGAGDGARDGADARDGAGVDAGVDAAAPTCSDGIKNSDETDIDCGGHCGKCSSGKVCVVGADCTFGFCRTNRTCGECNVSSDCPGTETECVHRSCTAGVCGMSLSAAGTVLAQQTVGDCQSRQCATDGTVKTVADNSDIHDDRNPCTNDTCAGGVPMNTNLPVNSSCGGQNRCNTTGQCVGCLTGTDCPGSDTVCQTRTCTQGICGVTFKAKGFALSDPTAGDCEGQECDGMGNIVISVKDNDLPVDGNPCTTDECSAGTAAHHPIASGTTCGTGLVCDGANRCVACLSASTCPGTDTECHTRTCLNGTCGISNTAAGRSTAAQVARDCKRIECDGAGSTFTVPDVTDLPLDNNPCTSDGCNGDTPQNPSLMAGTNCGGTNVCDGAGMCVGCLTAATCPGSDTDCHSRTCSATHQCGILNAPAGKLLPLQIGGDCHRNQCDGAGNPQTVVDTTDVPVDGKVCTDDICVGNGSPMNPPLAQGTSCGTGLMCNGGGLCVGCVTAADCGTDTPCLKHTCTAAGQCMATPVASGTVLTDPTPGDCKHSECDGAGNIAVVADDTDVPVDGNACTQDVCMRGTPSNPPQPADSACSQNGGSRCNGIAGASVCVQCNTASQCPGGNDTECHARACSAAGICSIVNTPAGTVVSGQTPGDCQRNQCDNMGNIVAVPDPTDVQDDLTSCTVDTCNGTMPVHMSVTQGTLCGDHGGVVCSADGHCVGCNFASECPGSDTECHTRVCTAGMCGVMNTADGTVLSAMGQTPGDCHTNVCNGGNIKPVVDNSDVFVDAKQCTQDLCSADGMASNPAVTPAGTTCNQNGGSLCDATGACVQCLTDANCDTSHDNACGQTHCVAGACTLAAEIAGTPVADTTAGDCHSNQCDGMGNISSIVDDRDLPANSSECVVAACMGGVPSLTNRPHGYSCTQNSGRTCNGAGSCLFTVSLVRVGTGAAALDNTSTAAFIEERKLDGTLVGTPVALPVTEGASHAFGLSGTATSDGELSLSADGRYLIVPGYNSPAGTAGNVVNTASATVSRLVARIDASGAVDTSTLLGSMPFTGNNVRGATSNDGLEFWVGGAGGSSAGVWFITLGPATTPAPVQVYSAAATRWLQVIGGQLYGSSDKAPNANVFTVGSGLPTTAGQALTSLNGMPTVAGNSPFGFVAFDLDATVPGIDTIYVADDAANRGIQKWTAIADTSVPPILTWSVAKTINTVDSGTSPIGFRGLTGFQSGSSVTLIATTGEANGSVDRLVVIVDSGSAVPTGMVVSSSPANTTFRGVALSPHL